MIPVMVLLPDETVTWFLAHAREDKKSLQTVFQVAAEAYMDLMSQQRRADDEVYDHLRVPQKDRAY